MSVANPFPDRDSIRRHVENRLHDCADLWLAGKNTHEITRAIGLCGTQEWSVANAMPRIWAIVGGRRKAA